MKNLLFGILVCLCILPLLSNGQTIDQGISLDWTTLSELPPAAGQELQPGLAGAFSGLHNNVLIIAGGANFPDKPNWEGGQKVYHSDVYLLQKNPDNSFQWIEDHAAQLETPIGYGLSIPTDQGLVCIGGMNEDRLFANVFRLSWNGGKNELNSESLPNLPLPMANMAGGMIGNTIYVAGSGEGDGSKYFWSLNLENLAAGWSTLPSWPGSPRTHAVGVVQNQGEYNCFYLIKGRYKSGKTTSTFLNDIQRYDPEEKSWSAMVPDVKDPTGSLPLSAGTGIASGANHILLFGGDEGTLFNYLEKLNEELLSETDTTIVGLLIAERDSILKNHPGFSRNIYAFHTITQSWSKVGELPNPSQVTTNALKWDDQIVIPGGEIAPCVRTPRIAALSMVATPSFGYVNTIVLIAYLVLLIGFGFYFSRKQHSTDDFFKGGRRVPAWAAGISIAGTALSAITFMAVPAKTFATDWLYFFVSMTIIMVGPFIIRIFLPFYRRFNLTTAYEYLELRFNLTTRLIGSIMYILLQLGRMGIVLLLPSLALSVVTGIDVNLCILTMGILSIFYTVLGGIEAVIWTDVLQFFVLMGGALLSLALLFFSLDNQEIASYVGEFRKMRVFDFSFDLTDATLWVALLGGFSANIVTYGSDQTIIQRYLTTQSEKKAAKSISIGVWMALPTTLTFFTIGTLLFVYYKVNPGLLNPALDKTDSIYPWYIINSLPNGISGLLIAAIFAASMSSLDSVMNSVSTVVVTDYFRRLAPLPSEKVYLRVARILTIVVGILGTGMAIVMAAWGISSLWDQFQLIVGLFAGGLGGVFLLGILSKRANGPGAVIGLLLSGLFQFYIKDYTPVHFLLYAFTGLVSGYIFGYLASFLFAPTKEKINRYTIYGLKE